MPSAPKSSGFRGSPTWSSHDDEVLMQARVKGMGWPQIAKQYFPAKSYNACRKRHERLMGRKDFEDWDQDRLESLGRRYMDLRKEMWSVLGDAVGERYDVVEAKCMEMGLQNLKTASRHSRKRDQQSLAVQRGPGTAERDSAIGMDETEDDLDRSGGTDQSFPYEVPGFPVQGRRASDRSNGCGMPLQSMLS
ncbi:MAG: hypothetical protein M1828_001955 [Chrysothrix sp. TS-e1954]|nr:MAG: hypothetical protein M1828_001955 [Chrysothrix sp. TS-e1954]